MKKIIKLLVVVCLITVISLCLLACSNEKNSHNHEFSTEWKTSEIQHWHECSCGEKQDLANHTDEDDDGLCDACSYVMDAEKAELNGNYAFTLHQDGDDAYYSVSGKNKNLTAIDNIPSFINDIPIKVIDDRGFSEYTNLTSINLPNTVTSIGNSAFYGCIGLTSITLPDSVTSIGESAFSKCIYMTSVVIPSSVTKIGKNAFLYSPIVNATMPINAVSSIVKECLETLEINGGESIPDSMFRFCIWLTSVTISDSVTSIGNNAFYGCRGLVSITLGSGLTNIGDYAFQSCYDLIEVYNKSSLNIVAGSRDFGWIGYYAKNIYSQEGGSKLSTDQDGYVVYTDDVEKVLVKYTGNLTELTLPSEITTINGGAFYANIQLTSIVIPDGVKNIGEMAFSNCIGIISLTIPGSLTSIGDHVFFDCKALKNINYTDDIASWCRKVWLEEIPRNDGFVLTINGQEIKGDFVMPDNVTIIENSAFRRCLGLTSITLPNSVTSIGMSAFNGCKKLTSITLGSSVTSIEKHAFEGCTSLTSVNYTGDMTSWFGKNWFNIIPKNKGFTLTIDGQNIKGDLIIPDDVTIIGDNAFEGFTEITSVTIPGSVIRIGEKVFANCSELTSINFTGGIAKWCELEGIGNLPTDVKKLFNGQELIGELIIPEGVTRIGDHAFDGFSGLTSVIIPDGVTSIGNSAFKYCTGLTKITMTSSVTSMGDYSLYECSSLKNITFDGDIEQYKSIEIGVAYDYNVHWQIIITCNNGKLDKSGNIITWEW